MRRVVFFSALLFLALGVLTACNVFFKSKPAIIITAPPSGSEFHEGEDVSIHSKATDAVGVARVELVVDGRLVSADSVPTRLQATIAFTQTWQATPGTHTILVQAYNADGITSNPAAISISVRPNPLPTPTTAPLVSPTSAVSATPVAAPTSSACVDSATFVADVTVPDGTNWTGGQTFNKIWRVRNTGCPWGDGYQLVFVSGDAMTTSRAIALPATATGATADLLVPMAAPTAAGAHNGTWRLRNPGGTFFGTVVTVKINVLGTTSPTQAPVAGPCSGTPVISSFNATQRIIPVFGSTTLTWGAVANAGSVEIDNGIGGVAAPGSYKVAPAGTTTYTLIARCGSEEAFAQVRILVPFAVSGLATNNDTGDYSGTCPRTVTFSANMTVTDAGTVTYKWESSDGGNDSGNSSITFEGFGTQTISKSWTLGSSGKTLADYWMRVHILAPNDVTSNNATFTLRCN
jgi:hypothetical protein